MVMNRTICLLLAAVILVAFATAADAKDGTVASPEAPSFYMSRFVVTQGGATGSGEGSYRISLSVAQPVVGTVSSDSYTMDYGFWQPFGLGGGCCVGLVGDANNSGDEQPTIGDISAIIDAKFITVSCDGIIYCPAEADVNQSGGSNPTCNDITIGDLTILIDYLFITLPQNYGPLPECP